MTDFSAFQRVYTERCPTRRSRAVVCLLFLVARGAVALEGEPGSGSYDMWMERATRAMRHLGVTQEEIDEATTTKQLMNESLTKRNGAN